MSNKKMLVLFSLAFAFMGCIPRHPTKTRRPEISAPPWQERIVKSTATAVEYRYLFAQGPRQDAPAMLLLHGGFFDERIWINVRDLSSQFNVYALSWPDDSPLYDKTFLGFGKVARDFLEALKIEDLVVAGVSMGSLAAIELAAAHNDLKIRGLVLCSAVMPALNEEEVKARMRIAKIAKIRSKERLRGFIEWRQARSDLKPPPQGPNQDDIFWVRPSSYYEQVFGAVENQGSNRQPTQLINAPVLLVSGTADETMPIGAVRQGAALFPDAVAVEVDEIEGADHTMVMESGPVVARKILGFLSRNAEWTGVTRTDFATSSPALASQAAPRTSSETASSLE